VPNRDTGLSPFELVCGRNIRGPLDLLYSGWVDKEFEGIDVNKWLVSLQVRLSVLHDEAFLRNLSAVKSRCEKVNRNRCNRKLKVGDRVLMKIPRICANLEEAWDGPYEVCKVLSDV